MNTVNLSHFICPVCGKDMIIQGKSLLCKNRHTYDLAKSGYTNLLLSQQVKAKHHGDDKRMVRSRQAFLDRGYYKPLLDCICEMVKNYAKAGSSILNAGCRILDAGCGECWYTAHIMDFLQQSQIHPELFAVDISKDALAAGAKRNPNIELAVASVFHLPVKENFCDMLLTFFAPLAVDEFRRVLKKNGILIRAIPLERHLWSLKAAVYDHPYENDIEDVTIEGFELVEKQEIRQTIHLACNEDILNVFTMTPYYYKTRAEDQNKLAALPSLDTEIEFGVLAYRKK